MQDMRNASRGEGGASELLRALGMVRNAAADFQQYQEAKADQEAEADEAEGMEAFAAGVVDPTKLAESKAYRAGVEWQRGEADWATRRSTMADGMGQLIQNQTDPDPIKRRAEVVTFLEQQNHDFAVGEDGQLRKFGSAAANRHFAEQMAGVRSAMLPQADVMIRKRMGEQSLEDMGTTVMGLAKAGDFLDPETAFARVLPYVDRRDAMETYIQAVEAAAGELQQTDPARGLQLIDKLLGWDRTRQNASVAQPTAAPTAGLLTPFQGFLAGKRTGKMGDARSGGSAHNGEDFPVPIGTPIVAPLGGEVVSSMRNARGGNQVRVRLDNRAIVGFAHLSSREVQVGQRVDAGAQLGLSGNTGKSTGPHVHMTMEVDGKKVSPSSYFSEQPAGAPALPTSEAFSSAFGAAGEGEAAGGKVSTITPLEGPLALSPGQVLHLQEFRRTYSQRAGAEAERQRSEQQAGNLSSLIARLTGAEGNYPTKAEVQAKVRAGAVSPQQGMQLLNIIDGDTRQARSDARQAAAWAREDRREGKEAYLRSRVGSLLGPVYAGRATITETVGKLTAAVSREADPELRQALMQSVHGELSQLQTLRQKGPEYQGAGDDLDGWEDTYAGQLGKVRLPRGMDTQSARALIRSKMDEVRTDLGRGNVSPEKVRGYMESAERRLDMWFSHTFPPRPVAKR
ncbi:M23 family metallopeptidase [Novosphingobium panipatense]